MKKINILILAALCAFCGCSDNIDSLKGTYDVTRYEFTDAVVSPVQQTDESYKTIEITLRGGSDNAVFTFGSSTYKLASATYSLVSELTGTRQYYATINGSAVTSGDVDVQTVGDTYYFSARVTAGGKDIILKYKGDIDFGELPEDVQGAYELTSVLVYTDNSASSEQITLKFGTDGVGYYYDWDTWADVYTGTGYYFATDIYSPDGKLYAGTYTPADNDACGAGNFVKGYDTEMWGMTFTNWGTCWFSVDNGDTEGEKVTDGTIVVAVDGDTFTITINTSVVEATYVGPIDDANPNL
ncbi:MAG: hypothetical protein LUD72_14195 [Bacteroidales bacterium]|nr:hypothetical protein [Bacteroidales bacterium]